MLSLRPIRSRGGTAALLGRLAADRRDHLDDEWVRALLGRPTYLLRRGPDPDEAAARLIDELAASPSVEHLEGARRGIGIVRPQPTVRLDRR